jgi:hypothetical protein
LFAWSTWRVIFLIFGASWRNSVGACFTQSAAGPISRLDSHTDKTSPPTTTTNEPIQRGTHSLHRRVTSGLASSASSIASITGISRPEASQQAARETITAISRTGARYGGGSSSTAEASTTTGPGAAMGCGAAPASASSFAAGSGSPFTRSPSPTPASPPRARSRS